MENVLEHPIIFERKREKHATFKPELSKQKTALQRLQSKAIEAHNGCC